MLIQMFPGWSAKCTYGLRKSGELQAFCSSRGEVRWGARGDRQKQRFWGSESASASLALPASSNRYV
jgi:hypothetical protein